MSTEQTLRQFQMPMLRETIRNFISICALAILSFLFTDIAGAATPNVFEKADNRYIVQSSVCYGTKFTEISRLPQLPPQIKQMLEGVSDKGGEFNATDVGGGPHQRFVIGAMNQDVALIVVENGGIGYNVQLWSFLRNDTKWEVGPANYFGFSKEVSESKFLEGVRQVFGCKNELNTLAIKNDRDAANAMRHDADLGDITAQYALGLSYASGRGVFKNSAEGEKWFAKAAATNVDLQFELGKMYAYGKNLPQNYPQAMKYFRMVANQNQEEYLYLACYELGLLYENGRGVPTNKIVAMALFDYAHLDFMSERSDPGRAPHADRLKASLTADEVQQSDTLHSDMRSEWYHKKSITNELDYFLAHGRGKLRIGEVDNERNVIPKSSTPMKEYSAEYYYLNRYVDVIAKKYLEKATKGDAVAENMLGVFSLWAWGAKRDYAEAFSWFQKSAGHGNRTAMSNLAYMYQQGLGVGANLKQASYWYGRAADLHDMRATAMLPIINEAIAQPGNPKGSQVISDSWLIGSISTSCNEHARDALKMAELQIPAPTSKFEFGPGAPGEMGGRKGYANEDFGVELINEYAWAGCFKEAGRVLDSYRGYSPYFHNRAISGVVEALAHFGQYDRAMALAYSTNDKDAQDGMLRDIIVAAALDGNYVLAIDFADSLIKPDQYSVQFGYYYAMKALADKGDYAGLEKIGLSEKIHGRLGLDGNLLLAKALYLTNDRTGAIRALRDAQSRIPDFSHLDYDFDSPINHVSMVQALLEPEAVDTSMQSVTGKSNNYRIRVLLAAVQASTDKKWQLHWLDEIDQLSSAIVERQKDLRDDDLRYVCEGAQDYANLDMYQHAFDLLQQRGCGFNLGHQEQVSQDLGRLFQIAAVKNDIGNVVKLMPPELGKPEAQYQHHIFPLVYGLTRAGRYSEALSYMRQVEGRQGPGTHPKVEDLLAEIGKTSNKDFPVQDWIAEVNDSSAKLDLNRSDAFRILFSICTRNRGYDAAQSLAKQFTGEDLASAEIGIAEGLRGFQLGQGEYDRYSHYLHY